ncbi:hypothetical protein F3Y22_tig00110474pilonHSYRG00270 [Hibiscus syriacus]|uniref:Uncharacterized protein n=1 Tax=Hibiscus syriacus TaxID=106335 RepID=A0A6A3AIT0_HIBSY|nr:hypothetical protein F3Y22_tig00110474pilonHSYRG00270 [Hibiscus syriacus]
MHGVDEARLGPGHEDQDWSIKVESSASVLTLHSSVYGYSDFGLGKGFDVSRCIPGRRSIQWLPTYLSRGKKLLLQEIAKRKKNGTFQIHKTSKAIPTKPINVVEKAVTTMATGKINKIYIDERSNAKSAPKQMSLIRKSKGIPTKPVKLGENEANGNTTMADKTATGEINKINIEQRSNAKSAPKLNPLLKS